MNHGNAKFDIVIVGGGHAGIEAAWASARLGCSTALVVMDPQTVGAMSCNPAIGGLAKGHLVREIDALGGLMGRAADATGLQFRMLNASKGPAVRGPRAQIDRHAYARWMQTQLASCPGLEIIPGEVVGLVTGGGGGGRSVAGVVLGDGRQLRCGAVVLTSGTFLDGVIHCGMEKTPAGRFGEKAAVGLGEWLKSAGLETGRLKTGTPPRLDPSSIQWDVLEVQPGDERPQPFSFSTGTIRQSQMPCHITFTNERTHEVVLKHLHESAVYGGRIAGPGPRYCPSLEDKCARFPGRERHQIFLEPEERAVEVIYPNGISTSLPARIQEAFLRTIAGLENVRVLRPGYAIEYTMVLPHQLSPSLEVRAIPGLFLAGQINGTTGYEEAAAQGIVAGINAAKKLGGGPPTILARHEAYIGVLIDDLVTKDHSEPYRMFTSRAEHRLLLRQDNADLRLTPLARRIGLIDDDRWFKFERYRMGLAGAVDRVKAHIFTPTNVPADLAVPARLDRLDSGLSAWTWLSRPESDPRMLEDLGVRFRCGAAAPDLPDHEWDRAIEQADIEAKYGGYIQREERWIARRERQEFDPFPEWLQYETIAGLRAEAAMKLARHCPKDAATALRIAGVNPTDIALVQVHIHTRRQQAA